MFVEIVTFGSRLDTRSLSMNNEKLMKSIEKLQSFQYLFMCEQQALRRQQGSISLRVGSLTFDPRIVLLS